MARPHPLLQSTGGNNRETPWGTGRMGVTTSPSLHLSLFGPPTLVRAGEAVALPSRRVVALLAYLALEEGTHARDRLALLLYPDATRERGRARLRNLLSILGRELGPEALRTDRSGATLAGSALSVNASLLHALLADTASHGHPAGAVCGSCAEPLERAVALIGGPFMDGFALDDSPEFEAWQQQRHQVAQRDAGDALARLAALYRERGELDPALDVLQKLVALEPLDAAANRALIEVCARSGRRQAALRAYDAFAALLADELGAEPDDDARALRARVAAGELKPATRVSVAIDATRDRATPLVGRERAWTHLQDAYARASHAGRFVGIEGESGIGKTRLAEAFAGEAAEAGTRVLTLRCYEGEGAWAYGPVVDALEAALRSDAGREALDTLAPARLSQLARLVDLYALGARAEGTAAAPDAPPGDAAPRQLFEAVTEAVAALVAGVRPGIVLLDDLQWADGPTLELLTYAVRRLASRPLLALATWRDDAVPRGHRLRALVAEAQRSGVGSVFHLERLEPAAVARLASRRPPFPPHLAARLHRETEGLPLLVVAYLAAFRGVADANDGEGPWPVPGDARDLLRARLDGTPARARPLLLAAAVLGRPADAALLGEVAMLTPEESVTAVEDLLGRGVLTETPDGNLTFSHEKLRVLAAEEASGARRALLHRRLAEALARRAAAEGTDALAGQIAGHLREAGDAPAAASWFARAGRHARAVSASSEAIAHFRAALDLGHADTAGLLEAIGDLHTLVGHYGEAIVAYGAALDAVVRAPAGGQQQGGARAADGAALGRLKHKRAEVWGRLGEWERAEAAFERARHDVDAADRPALLADLGRMLHRRGDTGRAAEAARAALAGAEAHGNARDAARAHNLLGSLARSAGEGAEARAHFERSLELASGDLELRVAALNNLALLWGAEGDTARALDFASSALELCRRLGDRPREAALHSNLADLLHERGDAEGAMRHLKDAAAIYADVAREAEAWVPEVWKLSEW